jgi:hypothetical protein
MTPMRNGGGFFGAGAFVGPLLLSALICLSLSLAVSRYCAQRTGERAARQDAFKMRLGMARGLIY